MKSGVNDLIWKPGGFPVWVLFGGGVGGGGGGAVVVALGGEVVVVEETLLVLEVTTLESVLCGDVEVDLCVFEEVTDLVSWARLVV